MYTEYTWVPRLGQLPKEETCTVWVLYLSPPPPFAPYNYVQLQYIIIKRSFSCKSYNVNKCDTTFDTTKLMADWHRISINHLNGGWPTVIVVHWWVLVLLHGIKTTRDDSSNILPQWSQILVPESYRVCRLLFQHGTNTPIWTNQDHDDKPINRIRRFSARRKQKPAHPVALQYQGWWPIITITDTNWHK